MDLVERSIERGGGAVALRTRGDLAKAKGDKARALADYEALAETACNADLRLQLAKLYEHHVRAPERALLAALAGTAEPEEAQVKRVERLQAKLDRYVAREDARARALAAREAKRLARSVATKKRTRVRVDMHVEVRVHASIVEDVPHAAPDELPEDRADDAGRGDIHGVRYAPR